MRSRRGIWIVVIILLSVVMVVTAAYAAQLGRRKPRTKVERVPGGKVFASARAEKTSKVTGKPVEEQVSKIAGSAEEPPEPPRRLKPREILEKLKKLPGGQDAIDQAKDW
ncbi:hypothetical protein ACFL6S_35225 [Candidatus Poribacteria bacterium]